MTSPDSSIQQKGLCPCTFALPCFRSKSTYDLIEEAKVGIGSLVEIKQKQHDSLQVRYLENKNKIKELSRVGNRRKAFQVFKSNKIIEKRMNVLQKYMENLETQQYNLDDTDTNTQMIYLMSTIKKAMKKAGVNINVDDVADTVEDINDMNADLGEIQDILSNNISEDYDDLEEEFNMIFNETDGGDADNESKVLSKTRRELKSVLNENIIMDLPKVSSMERDTTKKLVYS